MPTEKYRIRLATDGQQELKALVSRGRTAEYKQTHARILLMSDEAREDGGMKDADISGALGVGPLGRAWSAPDDPEPTYAFPSQPRTRSENS